MKTSKPFSTISYNTKDFLVLKLNELVQRHKIDFYAFIEHLAEEDEKKSHKHLYIVPNGLVSTDELIDLLTELDPKEPLKPLRCIRCKFSKFFDWYMYCLHDTDYLTTKGQERKHHYREQDFVVSDEDYFREEIHSMDMSSLSKVRLLREAVESGQPFDELVALGQIPIPQVWAYKETYKAIQNFTRTTQRNGRKSHQNEHSGIVDPDTGEII